MTERPHRASAVRRFVSLGVLLLMLPFCTWGQLAIVPGKGVEGVVYLSDTVHSARLRNINEAVTITMADYYSPNSESPERRATMDFGLLGIVGEASATNAALTSIEVDVSVISSLDSSRWISCGGLIFGKGAQVSRDDVTGCFGDVHIGTQREVFALWQEGADFALKVGSHGECLYYSSRGVMFDVDETGLVRRVVVRRPRPGVDQGQPLRMDSAEKPSARSAP